MKLLHELRRRRVFRLAGLYIVGAWVVIQVAEALFQAWGIPETANRFVFIAAALCFPIALVFGWIFDVTSAGLIRTPPLQAGDNFDARLKLADFLILGALGAVTLVVLYDGVGRIHEEASEHQEAIAVLPNSIAVLPFDNLDTEQETAFFSDGVTEEILHRLSTLGSLHVIGRTSSFAFRGADEGPARIAELIGVRYLLHGSVRRDSGQVRVTARLTDDRGYQVWSQSFDRKLEGIFAIQSEIATTVSGKVLNKIVPLTELPAGRTTQNIDAYNEYLVGLAHINARPPGWQAMAEAAFRRSITLDETFAPPYAGLSIAMFLNNRASGLNEKAQEAAEHALELDAEIAAGHAALGLILAEVGIDLDRAITHLRRAIELDPSFVHAYNWLSIAYTYSGDEKSARAAQERGLVVDPMNAPLVSNVARGIAHEGDAERARKLLSRLTYLPEPPGLALWDLFGLETDFGRLDEAALWAVANTRAYARTDNPTAFASLASAYARLGLTDWADYWMAEFEQRESNVLGRTLRKIYWLRQRGAFDQVAVEIQSIELPPEADWPSLPRFVAAALAMAHVMAKDYDTAIRLLEAGPEPTFESFQSEMDTDDAIDFLHGLAFAYQETGAGEKAAVILEDVRSNLAGENAEGKNFPPIVVRTAQNAALRGEVREAIDTLQSAIELGFNDFYWIATDIWWGETAMQPEFHALLDAMKLRVDQQRARFESMHDEQAFRAEISALLQLP